MLNILNTVIALFAVIFVGLLMRWRGFFPLDLIAPLNRIVFYFAIPAMIFREVARTSFQTSFNPLLLLITLGSCLTVFLIATIVSRMLSVDRSDRGTFIQISIHGNLGYMGLAVAYYVLGKSGFATTSILAGFLILLQNVLSIMALQGYARASGEDVRKGFIHFIKKIALNPIILSSFIGMLFSVWQVSLPLFIDRALGILSSMALPLALLLIGASLSLSPSKPHLKLTAIAGGLKLLVLPGLGLAFWVIGGMSRNEFLPALVLLAAPAATVTYIMAGEMGGSKELASAAVSISTLVSLLTYIGWLGII